MFFRFLVRASLFAVVSAGSAQDTRDFPAFVVEQVADLEVPVRRIDAQSYLEKLGVLCFEIPAEARLGEENEAVWRTTNGKEPTGLSFEDLPGDTPVRVALWPDGNPFGPEDAAPGIPYRIYSNPKKGRSVLREGTIPFPPGFEKSNTFLANHIPAGARFDGSPALVFQRTGIEDKPEEKCELILPFEIEPSETNEAMNAAELYEATGILPWRIVLPGDLKKGEHLTFVWLFHGDRREESGLDTRFIPGGQEVQTFVWMDEWQDGDEKDRIRARFFYEGNKGEPASSGAFIEVPDTFTDIYGYLGPGDATDGAWVLMLTNRFSGDPYQSIVLEPFYRLDPL